MARGDGIDRTNARNMRLTAAKIGNTQQHNEREKDSYFYNHGGYDFAKQFYTEAYKAAIKIVGGEQYILSAVMHAD